MAGIYGPALQVLSDGDARRSRDVIREAAEHMGVSEEQRQIIIASGQEQWMNRGNWALL